jgi:hypothetical protein
MVRFEFHWYTWVIVLLMVVMIWKGPGTMQWFGALLAHGFVDTASALVRGLHGVQTCQHNPCGS